MALFEYILQVPANRIGYKENGGPFSLVELKVIQEVITLSVFVIFSVLFFKNETIKVNHVIGFIFLVLAVYFIFKNYNHRAHLITPLRYLWGKCKNTQAYAFVFTGARFLIKSSVNTWVYCFNNLRTM